MNYESVGEEIENEMSRQSNEELGHFKFKYSFILIGGAFRGSEFALKRGTHAKPRGTTMW